MDDRSEPGTYGQFCPVAMAAEIFCTRWTPLVLRELLAGSTRFSDIKRGLPRMSPSLLSKRLKELEAAGVVMAQARGPGAVDYRLTPAGEALRELVMGLGDWGQRWIEASLSLKNLDPSLLMWDMRRNLRPAALPARRCTIEFLYPERGAGRRWWLMVDRTGVDLCKVDPGFEVDLYVEASLRAMTSVWMGISTLKAEIAAERIVLTGDKEVAAAMHRWLGLSVFAPARAAPPPRPALKVAASR
jgi:DNA-binding HxlR family transcriptional regulator